VEAVRHALAAQDFERAASQMELAWPAMARSRQDAVPRGWLKALPDELIRRRPLLSAYVASALRRAGELEEAERRLQDAERWLENPGSEQTVANEEEFRPLSLIIAIHRASLAQARGDITGTMQHARRALASVQPGDHLGRAGAAGFLGLALWASGDLAAAGEVYAEAVTSMRLAGNHADAISGAMALAEMQIVRGRLREARRTLEQASQLSATPGAPVPKATADLLVTLSELDREQNDLETAEAHLQRSKALGEHASLPENRYRWPVAMARLRAAHGDTEGALSWLSEAERLHMLGFVPETRPIGALRARIWIAQGRLADAADWVKAQGLSAQDEPSYRREFEHLTLTRLLLAQYRANPEEDTLREASGLLARLLTAAEAGGRIGSVNEILLLQAVAYAARGAVPEALVPLERALAQAEPEGFVRLFVDEGQPMAALLERMTPLRGAGQAADGGRIKEYAHELLAAFGKISVAHPSSARPTSPSGVIPHPLIEPLSERELEVLRLLRTELSGPEIARQLVVSLNTLNTHTRNIYSKLGVNNRRAAVRRAEELNLS
jgi:LuxR family maltose regulon positive regulatory protein